MEITEKVKDLKLEEMSVIENQEEQGATLSEQLIESSRRNNVDLLESIISQFIHDEKVDTKGLSDLINLTKDPIGNSPLHLTCKYGSYEVLDRLLDVDGVDLNIVNPKTGETPLHYAVEYSFKESEYALFLVETLIEAGADPTLLNKDNLKPVQLCDNNSADNEKLVNVLQSAEYALNVSHLPPPPQIPDQDEGSGSDDEE